jgi:hypothetical protein
VAVVQPPVRTAEQVSASDVSLWAAYLPTHAIPERMYRSNFECYCTKLNFHTRVQASIHENRTGFETRTYRFSDRIIAYDVPRNIYKRMYVHLNEKLARPLPNEQTHPVQTLGFTMSRTCQSRRVVFHTNSRPSNSRYKISVIAN